LAFLNWDGTELAERLPDIAEILDKAETWEISEWALIEQDVSLPSILDAVPKSVNLIYQFSLRHILAGLMSLCTI